MFGKPILNTSYQVQISGSLIISQIVKVPIKQNGELDKPKQHSVKKIKDINFKENK